jgi:hypothetical protein
MAGEKVSNVQLTPFVIPLPGKKFFYGDYLDIDIHNDKLAVVYTAYDLSQQTEVNLITEETLSNGVFTASAINNTLAIIRNSDTAHILLNIEHPHKSKVKVRVEADGKKRNYTFNGNYSGSKRGWDQLLGALYVGKDERITNIKYRIKDTEITNVYKRRIRLELE